MMWPDDSTPQQPAENVLVIGGANMDIVGTACSALAMGDSNLGNIHCAPGGVARNIAENLARLGHITHLLSAMGDDAFGRSLLDATQAAGVHTGACAVLPHYNTSTYLSLHGVQGDLVVAMNDMAIVRSITPQVLAAHAHLLQAANAVALDCNLNADTLAWLLERATGKVFVDAVSVAKCERIRPCLAGIHTLKVNQAEAHALCGLSCHAPADMLAAATWLHTQGVRQVLISLGARGMLYSDAYGGHGWQDALACDVVNVNGAGDALLAGWIHATLAGLSLAQAARFAQACAAFTTRCAMANHPDLSVVAVTQFLNVTAITTP